MRTLNFAKRNIKELIKKTKTKNIEEAFIKIVRGDK